MTAPETPFRLGRRVAWSDLGYCPKCHADDETEAVGAWWTWAVWRCARCHVRWLARPGMRDHPAKRG